MKNEHIAPLAKDNRKRNKLRTGLSCHATARPASRLELLEAAHDRDILLLQRHLSQTVHRNADSRDVHRTADVDLLRPDLYYWLRDLLLLRDVPDGLAGTKRPRTNGERDGNR